MKPLTLDSAAVMFRNAADAAQRIVDKFAADFGANPMHAFSWSDAAVEAAANVHVYRALAAAFSNAAIRIGNRTNEEAVQELLVWTNGQALRKASSASHSSSAMSNLVKDAENRAWINAVIMLNEAQGIYV